MNDEINHIFEKKNPETQAPERISNKTKTKSRTNKKRNSENENDGSRRRNKTPKRWITIPNFKKAEVISQTLEKSGMKVATNTGVKIQDVLETKTTKNELSEKSVVYEIPCKGCYKTYVGETGRGVDVRLKEHRSDVKFHRTSNAIVLHIEECHHLPDWNETKLLEKNVKKRTRRKVLEAAHILTRNTFNSRDGFITWSSAAAKLAVG